jgi:hypothetical protein
MTVGFFFRQIVENHADTDTLVENESYEHDR